LGQKRFEGRGGGGKFERKGPKLKRGGGEVFLKKKGGKKKKKTF